MAANCRLRVLLVDDQILFRKGLVSLCKSRRSIEIVGEAQNGNEAVELAHEVKPDLVLMGVHLPDCGGIEAVKVLKREMPKVKVIMLSSSDDNEDLFAAIKNGADGYLLKNIDPAQFFCVLEGMQTGIVPLSGALVERILREFRRMDDELRHPGEIPEPLTPRELEALALLVKGEGNKEIANTLHVSENTVKLHLHTAMEKLHLSNRIQLVAYAVRQGLVPS